jgi:type I restriction enzyme, R subunit
MKTDTSEKGLEALIVSDMTAGGGWIAGNPKDYDRIYAVDLAQLGTFLGETQSTLVEPLDLANDSATRQKFLAPAGRDREARCY